RLVRTWDRHPSVADAEGDAVTEQPQPDRTVELSADEALDAGLAAAFGADSGPPLPPAGSVLKALSAVLPEVPRGRRRDPDTGPASPIVRPQSEQMPEPRDPAATNCWARSPGAAWGSWPAYAPFSMRIVNG